jgi:hypothetical protein
VNDPKLTLARTMFAWPIDAVKRNKINPNGLHFSDIAIARQVQNGCGRTPHVGRDTGQ